MNKYGQAAVEAVELIKNGYCHEPKEAWERATESMFGKKTPGQQKGCPRNAFLGLCEEGIVKGVASGNYCSSQKNKAYAVRAIEFLKKDPGLIGNKNFFWRKAVGGFKAHNNQMDVVIALWEKDLIHS